MKCLIIKWKVKIKPLQLTNTKEPFQNIIVPWTMVPFAIRAKQLILRPELSGHLYAIVRWFLKCFKLKCTVWLDQTKPFRFKLKKSFMIAQITLLSVAGFKPLIFHILTLSSLIKCEFEFLHKLFLSGNLNFHREYHYLFQLGIGKIGWKICICESLLWLGLDQQAFYDWNFYWKWCKEKCCENGNKFTSRFWLICFLRPPTDQIRSLKLKCLPIPGSCQSVTDTDVR